MEWLGYVLFYFGFALQVFLLGRFIQIRIWRHYSFFFIYFSYTLISSISGLLVLYFKSQVYLGWYWTDYLAGTVLRFAVAWEIFRQIFPSGSHTRRVAGCILIVVLCMVAICFYQWSTNGIPLSDVTLKMCFAIVAWIFVVLGMAKYYGLVLGLNIKGMTFGFLGYMCTQVMLYSAGEVLHSSLRFFWPLLTPLAFIYMIAMWTYTLWVYIPKEPAMILDEAARGEVLALWEQQMNAVTSVIRKATKL